MTHLLRSAARRLIVTAAVAAILIGGTSPRPARAATPAEVDKALERAQQYILSQQKGNNWEFVPSRDPKAPRFDVRGWQWGGMTGVSLYGLLASGMTPKDPKIAPAIDWLAKANIRGHYASAMRAQVWTFLKDPKAARLNSNADYRLLMQGMLTDPQRKGFYSYFVDEKGVAERGWADKSVSQLAVLGMWACEQAGQEVPGSYWATVDAAWKAKQRPDGGWNYTDDKGGPPDSGEVTATMTAAGVATLFITQDHLPAPGGWSTCKGGIRNEHIDRGLAWLDRNADPILTGKVHHPYYALYGLERVGVASGRKFFGTVDWYARGADFLVKNQNPNGSWGGPEPLYNPGLIPDTVFSMLFLVRGRAPVVMNKLEYHNGNEAVGDAAPAPAPATPGKAAGAKPQPDPWNQRPRDAANFAEWAGKQIERYLNWQVVNLKVPSTELHDAPILYIAGSEPLRVTDEEADKLRSFVEEGGVILGNADCGDADFARSFAALGRRLFPKYEFRPLPPNHPILVDQQYRATRWKTQPRVDGLSNGVRELMILIPDADAARAWQARSERTKAELYELMQNIFLYAVDKSNLQARGETYLVLADPNAKADRSITVARLLAGDNPDPEPGGWRRLANVLRNGHKLDVDVKPVRLGDGSLAASGATVAHLTGTAKFTLSAGQQAELKAFVAAGGTLVVDAAGGSGDFATAAEQQLAATFGGPPGNVGTILPPDSPVFNLANAKVERFHYRNYVKGKVTGALNAPRVRGITQGGRTGVFYSREDLTAGLVGQPVDGILGYAPATATEIMRNLVLYAAQGPAARPAPPSATPPAPQAATPVPPPPQATQPAKGAEAGAGKAAEPERELPVSAADLVRAYAADETAADKKYNGKLLRVKGKVQVAGRDFEGKPFVLLSDGGGDGRGVRVFYPADKESAVARMKVGSVVEVRGRCKGATGNVLLDAE